MNNRLHTRCLPVVGLMVLAVSVLISSCLPDPLEVENVPRVKAEIVVSSQIIPDRSLLVLLTSTFGALEGSDNSDPEALLDLIAIDDATVTIEGPDGMDTLRPLGNGAYGNVQLPLYVGDEYRLRVQSPTHGQVYATTRVNRQVQFDNVAAELYYNAFNDTLAQITYSIADAREKNFYMLNVQEVEREDVIQNLINPRAFTMLLDDASFNGQTYGERFLVFQRDYAPGDSIAVSLSNISEDYYQFMKLRMDNRFSFVEFISEPVNYPSNVVGGRGFFNLHIPDVRFFVLN